MKMQLPQPTDGILDRLPPFGEQLTQMIGALLAVELHA